MWLGTAWLVAIGCALFVVLFVSPVRADAPAVANVADPPSVAAALDLDPAELEQRLWLRPEAIPPLYQAFGEALANAPQNLDDGSHEVRDDVPNELLDHLMTVAGHRARRLAAEPSQSPPADAPTDQISLLTALLQIDPRRFHLDPGFRQRVAAAWPSAVDPGLPVAFRTRLVERLADLATDDLDLLEAAAVAWGVARRGTAERRVGRRVELSAAANDSTHTADELAPIEASFFSAPAFLGAEAVADLVASVRRHASQRRILVLADSEVSSAVGSALGEVGVGGVDFLPSLGIDYSPWPRDPMTWARRPGAPGRTSGLHVVLRGNVQRGREADRWMGRALVQALPESLDQAWGEPTWQRSEQPFHNGQILDADGASWVSIHSLEPRILEILGLDRVPLERFDGPEGRRYIEAARQAAHDLSDLRRRPVCFVHALPNAGAAEAEPGAAKLRELGGGAGIDLDSVLTLLPGVVGDAEESEGTGQVTALVADLDAGTRLLRSLPDEELAALLRYGLPAGPGLRQRLVTAHDTPSAAAIDLFLEQVARHLTALGMTVQRLPLLRIDDPSVVPSRAAEPFLVGWNNVVLERRDGDRWAEGFSSLLPSGDEVATRAFAEAGYGLRLHPPLIESVLRNGGYRCASQHVRRVARLTPE